jgi:hypothetical protein
MIKSANKLPIFSTRLKLVLDDALKEGARDILINGKTKAPHSKGGLRSDTEVKKVSMFKWRVSFFKEYARFQEFGGDGSRTVRNYSTPGTGKGFLKEAGDDQKDKLTDIIKKHGRRIRV